MPERLRQFVVLRHELAGGLHWDLCLDTGEALATWQVAEDPVSWARSPEAAVLRVRRIADHRRAYLDYEGPVSGDRGQVTRADRGQLEILDQQPGHWTVQLDGALLAGRFRLEAPAQGDVWELRRISP